MSGFGDGDEINVAVRMVTPLRREFGRPLDVSHFLHDAAYARSIIDLAKSSKDARLRGYAIFLEGRMGLGPAVQVLAEPVMPRPAVAPRAAAASLIDDTAFAQAKRLCARSLIDALGPTAERLCLRIEAAPTPADLIVAAQRAHAVVRDVRGAAAADSFGVEVEVWLKALRL